MQGTVGTIDDGDRDGRNFPEVTLDGFPGDLAVVSMDGQRVDIFARAPE